MKRVLGGLGQHDFVGPDRSRGGAEPEESRKDRVLREYRPREFGPKKKIRRRPRAKECPRKRVLGGLGPQDSDPKSSEEAQGQKTLEGTESMENSGQETLEQKLQRRPRPKRGLKEESPGRNRATCL